MYQNVFKSIFMWNLHFRNPPSAAEYFPMSTHSGGSYIFKIWCSQGDVTENSGLLWCYTLIVGDWFLMLWRNILPWSSRVKQSKKTSLYRRKCCDKLVWQYHIVDCKGGKQADQGGVGGVWLSFEVLGTHHRVTLCRILEDLKPGYGMSYYTCI